MTTRKKYRIHYNGHVVEGIATSPQNAARLAFKKLISAGLIKRQPPTDINVESTFENTVVELVKEEL